MDAPGLPGIFMRRSQSVKGMCLRGGADAAKPDVFKAFLTAFTPQSFFPRALQ
jgi:hypothetical protein